MAAIGAAMDPKWVENEIEMIERTLAMYQAYAAGAKNAQEAEKWKTTIAGMEHRLEHAKGKLEKARKQYALKVGG